MIVIISPPLHPKLYITVKVAARKTNKTINLWALFEVLSGKSLLYMEYTYKSENIIFLTFNTSINYLENSHICNNVNKF